MDWVSEYRKAFRIRNGILHWLTPQPGRRKPGLVAQSMSKRGYYVVRLHNKIHYVHRVIFAMIHGYLPKQVDHFDGVRTNNSISNLRPCTNLENSWNRTRAMSKTGHVGVTFCKQTGKYRAVKMRNGRSICLGRYERLEDAVNARAAAVDNEIQTL